MVKNRNEGNNVNEPGTVPDDSIYYESDAAKEELERLPVEYLGFLKRQRQTRWGKIFLWVVVLAIIFGFGPGLNYQDYSPRTGELRTHLKFAWGNINYINPEPIATEWTEWYWSKNPEPANYMWVPFGRVTPALFGYLSLPFGKDLGWDMPENLVERMMELDCLMRPGFVLDIPRVLSSVDSSGDWNAIMLPLTEGTPDEALEWWEGHKALLQQWSDEELGTPLPEAYVDEAGDYVGRMRGPSGNEIPLFHE